MVAVTYQDLTEHQEIAGFEATAVYKNGMGQAMGGRFIHQKTRFTLDLIEIQTVPQSFLSVHTFPVSNMGEPHTQEHLVLGKGNVGRAVAARETMSMIESTAFTQQLKTCYPFAANAGVEAYFEHFERSSYALLNPDYTDEEIRREVRHFGVRQGENGNLELEEKGAIYTEMLSASAQPGYKVYRAMGRLLYGTKHPVSYDSGGAPAAMREMEAEDIRRFHAANYHLANMEMITSLPKGVPLTEALTRYDKLLTALQGTKPVRPGSKWSDLPAPDPQPGPVQQIVEFPSLNLDQPGPAILAWPARDRLNSRDESLADLFAQAFGGDPSTNLYKLFIDSKTRQLDIGARSVAMGFDNEPYSHFYVYIPDLAAPQATPARLVEIADAVHAELARVAAWPDGSDELRDFHSRMEANLLRMRRSADKLTSSPPGFGARMGQSIWPGLLRDLNDEPGFEKQLLQPELFAWLESVIASPVNIWREKIEEWKLLDLPQYSVAAKASSELIEAEETHLKQRLAAAVERLKLTYGVDDEQQAIARYQQDFDAATAELDRVQSMDTPARFIDHPPMTLDDQLEYTVKTLDSGVTLVTGLFSGMSSATIGLALDARELSGRQLIYAALFPQLLSGTGMTKDGVTLSYEDAMQRMRREILGVAASFTNNTSTGRFELVFNASGNTLDETKAALDWLQAMLFAPNWSADNRNRLKDLVDQSINALRSTMQRSEENWVHGPAQAWTYQDDPLFLSVSSFHAQQFHLHRLRWLLADPSELEERLEKDLPLIAADLPATSREHDLAQVRELAERDILTPLETVLAELDGVRTTILKRGNARLHLTASPENAAAIEPLLATLVNNLPPGAITKPAEPSPRAVARRVMQREGLTHEPLYVGLLAPNMQGGVHLHSVPGVSIRDLDEDSALKFLAFRLFSGGGPHGIFMKTWAAGLAYSNGLRSSAFEGRLHYYAERTTELPKTMQFVVDELKASPREKSLSEYALAQVFAGTRAGGSFESRTSAMAADLVDNWGPEVVRNFRQRILDLRNKPNLDQELYSRVDAQYAEVLPGYFGVAASKPGASFYVIGPEKQIQAWEKYLGLKVERLYARDYWVIVE
jgi:Zn-dependent M16 (insulinase) family peptidase